MKCEFVGSWYDPSVGRFWCHAACGVQHRAPIQRRKKKRAPAASKEIKTHRWCHPSPTGTHEVARCETQLALACDGHRTVCEGILVRCTKRGGQSRETDIQKAEAHVLWSFLLKSNTAQTRSGPAIGQRTPYAQQDGIAMTSS